METSEPVILRIYPDFTEVRREITTDGGYRLTFSEDYMSQIVPDSIGVDSDHLQMEVVTRKSTNLEGKTVYVRTDNTKPARKATLVRGDDWLVKDEESGRYYYAMHSQLEFEQVPAKSVFNIDFKFSKPTTAMLSYLTRTISWAPRYRIQINDDGEAKIRCSAMLKNQSPRKYRVEKAELYAGQVSAGPVPRSLMRRCKRSLMSAEGAAASPQPMVDFSSAADVAGIFQYELLNSFTLDSDSVILIEFLRPNITISETSQLEEFNPGNLTRSMNRLYTLISDQFLPSGNVNIRHGDRFVGSHHLADLPAGEKREFEVGGDASSLVERKEEILSKSELVTELKVALKISNNHSKRWDFRYVERNSDADYITYKLQAVDEVRQLENGVEVTCQMEAGKSFSTEYTITKRFKTPPPGPRHLIVP